MANPTLSFDFLAAGGSLILVIQSNGSITIISTEPNGGVETDNGTMEVDGSNVTLTLDGDVSIGTISRTENTLTLNLTSGVEADLDGDGVDEDVTLRVVLVKS